MALLLDLTADATVGVDAQGRITFVNVQTERLFGYRQDELLGHPVEGLLPNLFEAGQLGRRRLFLADPRTQPVGQGPELRARRKDGTEFPVEVGVGRFDHKSTVAIFFISDVSDIVRAERALLESREEFRLAVEDAPDALVIFDAEGRIQLVNAATERMFGFSRDDLLGKDFELVLPELLRNEPDIRKAADLRSWTAECGELNTVGRCEDGREFFVAINFSPLRMQDCEYIAASIRDISERRLLERQLRQAQKMEAVGRLAGGVAHDFNNLLTVVNGYAGLALENIATDHPGYDDVKQIIGAGKRASALTAQLMAFSRQKKLEPRVLNLNHILRDFEPLLRRAVAEDVTLKIVLDPALGKVSVDSSQMEQILMNLVVNARDAMPKGGTATLETRNVSLNETGAEEDDGVTPGDYVVLSITDTGLGMDEETQSHIFEPFFTTKNRDEGTGFGLFTVYGIVSQSGGHVRVNSAPGKGTRFEIYLPLVREADAPVESDGTSVDVPGGTETVLVVEDERQVRILLEQFLTKKDYKVLVARHAEEALQISRGYQGTIELVVTDMIMPGASGKELMKQISAERPAARVLYVSGHFSEGATQEEPPGDAPEHFLKKPFNQRALTRKVREVLDSAQ